MNENINFLRNKKSQVKKNQAEIILRVCAIGTLFLVAFAAVGMFVLRTQSKLSALEQEENQLQKNLSLIQDRTIKFILVQDRIKSISQTLKTRSSISPVVEKIMTQIPKDVILTDLSIDKKKVIINISSSSLASLNIYTNTLSKTENASILFRSVVMDSLTFDGKSRYSMQINAELL
jgi:Tfp pilus assembly protein PilN